MTLIEVLVTIGISVIVSGMLIMVWISLTSSYTASARGSESGELARDAVSRFSREIRDAEPYAGLAGIREFDAFERVNVTSGTAVVAFVEFTTTFNQEGNDQPLPTPVLTRYEYRISSDGVQTLHRIRYDSIGDEVRDDLVVRHLANYVRDPLTGDYIARTETPSGTAALPIRLYYLNADSGEPTLADASIPPKYLALVSVNLLVQMPGADSPKPVNLRSTIELRNQGL